MRGPRWLAEHLAEAERLVDEAQVDGVALVEWLETLLGETQVGPGRPRGLSVRTLFVALQLGAFDRRYFLSEVPDTLDELGAAQRERLGLIPTGPTVSYRQVCYLVERINLALRRAFTNDNRDDDSRYHDFDQFFQAMATSGTHGDADRFLSIAVDGSDIPTWGSSSTSLEMRWNDLGGGTREAVTDEDGNLVIDKVRRITDRDAGFRGQKNDEGKDPHFGYALTVAVTARDEDGTQAPLAAVAARLRPTNYRDRQMGLAVIGEVHHRRGRLGDVLADRGYTSSKDGTDFLLPIRALGGEPVFDLTKYQVGPSGTVRGALIIDGRPYSPAIPQSLLTLVPPRGGEDGAYKPDPAKVRAYQQAIAARAAYALDYHSKRPTGSWVFTCPAASGKVDCPLRAPRIELRPDATTVLRVPEPAARGAVCTRAHTSFALEDLPLAQRHIFGSLEWYRSYSRRGTSVETYFANLKHATGAGIERGAIRVRGIIKTGMLLAFALSSTNRRCAIAYERGKVAGTTVQQRRRGRPRRQLVTTLRQVIEDARTSPTIVMTT